MSDLFHERVPDSYIEAVSTVMELANWHTYQVLTKRSERLSSLLSGRLRRFASLRHVWWGVSVEDRRYGLPRVADLRAAPAAVRFLSIEPLLADLGRVNLRGIHWVIVGGESGHGARPMDEAWVRSLRDQCRHASVPFFFKQWGGVFKSRAGRVLDGKTWDEMPTAVARVPAPDRAQVKELLARGEQLEQRWTMRGSVEESTRRGSPQSAA